MKRYIVWISAFLMLCGLMSFASISLAQEGKWTRKADMPTARWFLSTSVVDGKIYAIGGTKSFDGPAARGIEVEEYDPKTDTWTKKADMPTARFGLSTSVVNGKIYAIGGLGVGDSLSTVEEYNPRTDEWRKKADMPTKRDGLSTSVVDGKIYAIGGVKWVEFVSTVEEYDPKTDKWTKKANMPTARYGLSTSVVNGKIYAIGGVGGGASLSTVEEYDPKPNTWTRKADMLTKRERLSTSVVDGKIYAIGGSAVDGLGKLVRLSTVEEYDPKTDTWTKKADMPTKRDGLSTSVVDGKIYAIGGFAISNIDGHLKNLSTVEEYDTGFEGLGIEAKGKLVTSWGKIKTGAE